MSPFPDVQYHFIPSLPFLSSPKVLSSFSISEKHKGLAPSLSRKQMQRMEKMFGSMGAGTLIWQKHERRNKWWETGAVEVWGIDENRRGENEDGGVGGGGRGISFYFLFFQNEFQGSSAPGDVCVHRQTASYKYRIWEDTKPPSSVMWTQTEKVDGDAN